MMTEDKRRICVMDTWKPVNADKDSVFVALSHANDLAEGPPKRDVVPKPMLAYNTVTLKNRKQGESYYVLYDSDDWDKIENVLNNDGDKPVFNGLVIKDTSGQKRVDVNSVGRTEIPFDAEKHKQKTLDERTYQMHLIAQERREITEQREL